MSGFRRSAARWGRVMWRRGNGGDVGYGPGQTSRSSASPSPPGRMNCQLVLTAHPARGDAPGLLGTDFVDDVERGLGGAPEPGETGVGDDLPDGGLAGLRAEGVAAG